MINVIYEYKQLNISYLFFFKYDIYHAI